jgi:agmatine/peptidylarginine deiminase
MELIKYRDAGMATYTYFWTIDKRVVSPYFDSENDAQEWLQLRSEGIEIFSTKDTQ